MGLRSLIFSMASWTFPDCTALFTSIRSVMVARSISAAKGTQKKKFTKKEIHETPAGEQMSVQRRGTRGIRLRWVPDSTRNLSAASTKPSVTRKFMTRRFMSSLRILTSRSFRSHSSRVTSFLEDAMEAAGESMESRSRRTMRERNIRCAGVAGRGRGEARRGGCPGPIKPSPSAGGEGLGRLGFRGGRGGWIGRRLGRARNRELDCRRR